MEQLNVDLHLSSELLARTSQVVPSQAPDLAIRTAFHQCEAFSRRIGVMHIVDSLALGGTETVAVNLANHLPERYRPYLCSTRSGGPLLSSLSGKVRHLCLNRRSRTDVAAVLRLRKFIADENIQLLHVHSSSLFLARVAAALSISSRLRLIWHDHYGCCECDDRPAWLYRLAVSGAAGVIAVNQQLADWAHRVLRVPSGRVWFVPNFVARRTGPSLALPALPGSHGSRIICVANLRPQKDHLTLLRAFTMVRRKYPQAHLLLAGAPVDADYAETVYQEVGRLHLEQGVTFLGQVRDIPSILNQCDIGVLSSASEGLPLSLLEYGWAGLASVVTAVGQCPEVLDHGNVGMLVDPASPEQLAGAMEHLLESQERRRSCGNLFRDFVHRTYDPESIVNQICGIYDDVLS